MIILMDIIVRMIEKMAPVCHLTGLIQISGITIIVSNICEQRQAHQFFDFLT